MIASQDEIEAVTPRATALRMEPMQYLTWRKLLREDYAFTFRTRTRTVHTALASGVVAP